MSTPENSQASRQESSPPERELLADIRAERPRLGQLAPDPPPPPPAAGTGMSVDASASTAGIAAATPPPDPARTRRILAQLWKTHNLLAAADPVRRGWLRMSDPVADEAAALLADAFPELSVLDQLRAVKIIICVTGVLQIYIRQKKEWDAAHPPAGAPQAALANAA